MYKRKQVHEMCPNTEANIRALLKRNKWKTKQEYLNHIINHNSQI